MSDRNKPTPTEEEEKGYIPASPVKRTAAWIALAYVLLFLGLTTYFYFTGTMLGNLAPLLALPGLIGLGALAIVSCRTTGRPGRMTAILIAIVCWALAAFTLPLAWVGLMSNFSQVGVTIVTTFGG